MSRASTLPLVTDTAEATTNFSTLFESIVDNIATVVHGKRTAIEFARDGLLAEGHLLIEDVPGVGKTSLAKALAASIDCSWKRVQFTPDLLPTDLVGVSIYERSTEQFRFQPGPLFANIVLADEINRASPKTQSALLEAMEERQVSGRRHHPPAAAAVHGDRDPEPGRAGGHVPPARRASSTASCCASRSATRAAPPRSRSSTGRASMRGAAQAAARS